MKAQLVKYKKPIAVVVVLAIVLIGYFTREKWMSFFKKSDTTAPVNNASTNNATTATIDRTKVLKNGDNGASVKELQRLLNEELRRRITKYGMNTLEYLSEDGAFGSKTEARLELFTKNPSVKQISINDLVTNLSKQA